PRPGDAAPAADGGAAPGAAGRATLGSIRNVLFISVDSLRSDQPWTGYPRDVAPNLTRLAKESVVYANAYALSSYTSMSLGGLMAARYPSELPRDGHTTSRFFPDRIDFLAELLQAAGVRTIGVMGHVYFAGDTGISAGFDDWRVIARVNELVVRDGAVTDDKLADLMIAALDDHQRARAGARFFAWVHFMDPHFAYVRHAGFPSFSGEPAGSPLGKVGQARRDRYDGEVAFTDAQIGRVLERLRASPWASETAIIVTADHGEAFGEHKSYYEHGYYLFDVTTRVPLMFHVPGVPAARVEARRSHLDLAKTVLELLGVKPGREMRGVSLVPELLDAGRGAGAAARDLVIDMPYSDQAPRRRALIHGAHKLIETDNGTRSLLFDLDADPLEQRDLAAEEPALFQEMERRLRAVNESAPDFPAPRLTRRRY
ncbi:MAG: sulfatase, partial [Sorangiineae bacterium]|nr:sulfatase [Sorangiineae bacterium]